MLNPKEGGGFLASILKDIISQMVSGPNGIEEFSKERTAEKESTVNLDALIQQAAEKSADQIHQVLAESAYKNEGEEERGAKVGHLQSQTPISRAKRATTPTSPMGPESRSMLSAKDPVGPHKFNDALRQSLGQRSFPDTQAVQQQFAPQTRRNVQ